MTAWRPANIDPYDHDLVWVWGPEMVETDGMDEFPCVSVRLATPEPVGGRVRWTSASVAVYEAGAGWYENVAYWFPVEIPAPPHVPAPTPGDQPHPETDRVIDLMAALEDSVARAMAARARHIHTKGDHQP